MIRRININDLETYLDFVNRIFVEDLDLSLKDYSTKETAISLLTDPKQVIVVKIEESKIVALAKGYIKDHSAFLTAAVLKEQRGSGIAMVITDYLLDILRQEGVIIARSYVYSDNPSSMKVMEKMGFELSGKVFMHHFNKDKDQVDDLIFHKLLK
jgi:L-amino acid N-acyltransferase YncA